MHSFKDLVTKFADHFAVRHFPQQPASLYEPNEYFLSWGGKRIRPVMCLMGNELFDEIHPDSFELATAIELFHNFTLIHDDIMDEAPLRRGMETVHMKYGLSTALLAGDVMLIKAYDYLNKIQPQYLHRIIHLFNKTAREVCEGQQMDMDFEQSSSVSLDDYINMISLKTSVLLAASLEMGAIIGGASEGNCKHLYEFGKNLGIAFQVQDDYLDAFGDPEKFGKDVGGDIRQNKKTFLMLHALEVANAEQKNRLFQLMQQNPPDKVEQVLQIFRDCNIDEWAKELKDKYLQTALQHLEAIAVRSVRKEPLQELANFLIQREY
ncbi:MAG: polyprenyl synthetase family protein [Sediminibacterium sp. Gen4]|jgi:geranylgeranyl diphosphate synthase, type II|uniref:polyprenyl synthetase family protein n=1 Tax=unclassified Sediminibacterium TaxID=2635961 RepID=UPI0015C0CEC0|nr:MULTISPECIES: polyprenyl synthetase family protein [unclassified Sediminibacterium]MBW0160321.1 polyprenyl synthetase family protein [Sediminibacterium sp.]MBW0164143.1 polyprenyl synthetase family protein [Sediminibacterium sp.]NWK66694.1 polyprenyl synthetase family protein [Sediminibacterium sp. Gen4]